MKLPCVEALEMVHVGEKYAKKKEADRQNLTLGPLTTVISDQFLIINSGTSHPPNPRTR